MIIIQLDLGFLERVLAKHGSILLGFRLRFLASRNHSLPQDIFLEFLTF